LLELENVHWERGYAIVPLLHHLHERERVTKVITKFFPIIVHTPYSESEPLFRSPHKKGYNFHFMVLGVMHGITKCVNTKNWYRKGTDLWAEFGKEMPFGRKFSSTYSVKMPAVGSTPSFGRRAVLCLEEEAFRST
jgi:hypothetical protein